LHLSGYAPHSIKGERIAILDLAQKVRIDLTKGLMAAPISSVAQGHTIRRR
jgi:hypothetical protein